MQYKRPVRTPASSRTEWPFLASLARDDLSPATLRGYRYDLRHFLAWHRKVQDAGFAIEDLADFELIAYRQHMVAAGRRPATVNRRLDALRRLCRWARGTGALAIDVARDVRPMRTARGHQPAVLTDGEVYAVLRAAGTSSHGLDHGDDLRQNLKQAARLAVKFARPHSRVRSKSDLQLTSGSWSFHQGVDFGAPDLHEAMASVERADRVPVQMLQAHRQAALVRQDEAMTQDGRADTTLLVGWEQVELAEPHMVRGNLEGERAEGLFASSNLKEWLLRKAALVKLALERLVPSSAADDVRAHGSALGLEGELDGLNRPRQLRKREFRRQVGQDHVTQPTTIRWSGFHPSAT